MGALNPFKRKQTDEFYDPFLPPLGDPGMYPFGGPGYPPGGYPPGGYPPGGYPPGGLGSYDPYNAPYPYEMTTSYGGPPGPYGGRYGRGLGGPMNYGNYYLGNTTMQMMPQMMRKVEKYKQRMGMNQMPMMPMMPMMPCLPAAPLVAAATPLPISYSPVVQSFSPMPSFNFANWMSPASFMSALSAAPMGFRPPASFEFPSGVGAVMGLPFGWNPLLSMPTFGGFSPQFSFGGGWSCSCTYCCPPSINFCPRPVSIPQPVPVPIPTPVPIPNIQQVPVPRPVQVVAPPIIAGAGQPLPFGSPAAPLIPSQGSFIQGPLGQTSVMASRRLLSSTDTSSDERKSPSIRKTNTSDSARRLRAEQLVASLSKLGIDNHWPEKRSRKKKSRHSRHKHRREH